MTDLTTTHLKHLLEQATPGPWERHPENARMLCNLERKFAVHAELTKGNGAEPEPEDVANTELIALAPQLAGEVLWMRKQLASMRKAWLSVVNDSKRMVAERTLANHAVQNIDYILGEHNE